MPQKFLKKLQNYIFSKGLLKRKEGIVVGISGGPDSVALTLALKKLETKMDLKLLLVHINYNLRGVDSEKDEQFIRQLAKQNQLELKVIKYKNRKTKGNLERRLREFRYDEFEKIRKKRNFDRIAVGHNLDDQAETFFLNLLRGSGTRGLGSIRVKRGTIIRPLLGFSRKEIENFLLEQKQRFRSDKTNQQDFFQRNKIRNKLLPHLEKNYLSNIKQRIAEIAENLQQDQELVEQAGLMAYNRVVKSAGEIFQLDVKKALKMDNGSLSFVFRRIISNLKGDLANLERGNFSEFEKILRSKKGKNQIMKMDKIVVERKGSVMFFVLEKRL
jgi:tRNA(Ile)-lysidine synthase